MYQTGNLTMSSRITIIIFSLMLYVPSGFLNNKQVLFLESEGDKIFKK